MSPIGMQAMSEFGSRASIKKATAPVYSMTYTETTGNVIVPRYRQMLKFDVFLCTSGKDVANPSNAAAAMTRPICVFSNHVPNGPNLGSYSPRAHTENAVHPEIGTTPSPAVVIAPMMNLFISGSNASLNLRAIASRVQAVIVHVSTIGRDRNVPIVILS